MEPRASASGATRSPLTEHGRAQAEAAAEALAGRQIDSVFHSPLGRAAATAHIVAKRLGLAPVPLSALAEVHHGAMAGLTAHEVEQEFPGALAERDLDKCRWRFPEGESYADAEQRAVVALASVEAAGVHRPLLVSHEMIGRLLLKQLLGLDAPQALSESHPNDVVHVVEPRTGSRHLLSGATIRTA